jgi:Rps23 Pro-64 3,4-dihydroxylase Tpa1-like proline 4-hydroxylase
MALTDEMLGPWVNRVDELADEFKTAEPFPLVVLDPFLKEEVAEGLVAEFPSVEGMARTNDYIFGDKRQESNIAEGGPTTKRYHELLLSAEFAAILSRLTGGRPLFVDAEFHGGGFHQGGDGSFLDTHVDFNIHPHHEDWLRVLNILLYLNKDWKPEYDGNLLVRNDPKQEPRAVAPLLNRAVIMLTADNTYHGYRRMTLPPGITRKSIAAYAYEKVEVGSMRARTTAWAPEDGGIVKRNLAKHWTDLVAAKDKVLRHK